MEDINNKKYICNCCEYETKVKKNLAIHLETKKHKDKENGVLKPIKEFNCYSCNYQTLDESNFKKHLDSKKHSNNILGITKLKKINYYNCNYCNFHSSNKKNYCYHMFNCFSRPESERIDWIVQDELERMDKILAKF